MNFVVGVGSLWLHNDKREQIPYSGQVTPDGVIVAVVLAVVLVSVNGLELRLRCELRPLCACLTCSVICFVLSSVVDEQ